MIIGLRPNEIRIAENSTSDPIRRDIQDYIISRSMQVPYELSQCESLCLLRLFPICPLTICSGDFYGILADVQTLNPSSIILSSFSNSRELLEARVKPGYRIPPLVLLAFRSYARSHTSPVTRTANLFGPRQTRCGEYTVCRRSARVSFGDWWS